MAEKEKGLQKTIGSFLIIGKVRLSDKAFETKTSDSGYEYRRMNLQIDCGKGNKPYVTAMGGFNPSSPMGLKFWGKEGMFEVDWEDRMNTEVIKAVPKYSQITVGVHKDDDNKTQYSNYLSWYDAIDECEANLKDEVIVKIRGNLKINEYKDNITFQKEPTSIYLVDATEEEFCAKFVQGVVIERDGIGKIDEKENVYDLSVSLFDYDRDEKAVRPYRMKYKSHQEDFKSEEVFKSVRKWLAPEKGQIHYVEIVGDIVESRNTRKATKDDYSTELLALGLWEEEELLDAEIIEGDGKKVTEYRLTGLNKKKDKDTNKITLIKDTNKYKPENLVFIPSTKNVDGLKSGELDIDDLDDVDIDIDDL